MCGICGCESTTSHTHHDHHHHQKTHLIQIEKNLLDENNQFAANNRDYFFKNKIVAFNFVSSPGSGKTSLLEKTILALKHQISMNVIEGDQQTDHDARRIRATGVSAVQINTGKACHLDAHMIAHVLEELPLVQNSLLFIENVGNLVCPALFDLGENYRIVILSVTEGDDKPLKYPDMFHTADLMILNKIDLLPYVDFNMERCIEFAKRINPRIESLQLSATSNMGMLTWQDWLMKKSRHSSKNLLHEI